MMKYEAGGRGRIRLGPPGFESTMIQLSGAGKRFGHKLLFENCDWLITPKERAGQEGAKGEGKPTLLKINDGMEPLDYGTMTFMKGITQGYLPQDGLTLSGRTIF